MATTTNTSLLDDVSFYMRVPLPDGTFTNGKIDYNHVPAELGIDDLDLAGKRVLDIAANDGFWTFWAESRGARDLLAIDVDSFDGYDWSWEGPPAEFTVPQNAASQWTKAGAGFHALRKLLGSKAERRSMSVYQLDPDDVGQFDIIFNFGLLYHLRHPLLSLDKCRAVCQGVLILETHLVNGFDDLPVDLFYRRDEALVVTNWNGPTEACVVNWLISAGFPRVFSNRTNTKSPYARRIFIACVDDRWAKIFEGNSRLVEFDYDFHERSRRATIRLLTPNRPLESE